MSQSKIAIVDYGMGNLGSIQNMIKHLGFKAFVSSNHEEILSASKLILSGVGSFDSGMTNLHKLGLVPVLEKKVFQEHTPLLGICLGMQLFTEKSEEGRLPGLSWIPGKTVRFHFGKEFSHLKIPHMGWNNVDISQKQSLLWDQMSNEPHFYFVHSYHLEDIDPKFILGTTQYGYDFISMIQKDNIIGVQFHPEKSHKFGMRLLKNFIEQY